MEKNEIMIISKHTYCFKTAWVIFLLAVSGVIQSQTLTVSPINKKLTYSGRIGFDQQDAASIYWPGSSVKIRFKGTSATASLKEKSGTNISWSLLIIKRIVLLR
jgi:hypothetical protein